MVKIHNTPEERNKEIDKKPKALKNNIDDNIILEMLIPNNKTKTSSLNIRLETSIVNQIEQYSNEHNTTKTEVIKDILIEYYANKKINKGTFQLKEPVTLIIPHSKELLTEYIENEVNIVTTVKETSNGEEIHALDPQNSLYKLEGTYLLETITEANNLLDSFDDLGNYYSYKLDTEKQYYEMDNFYETGLIDETEFNDFPYIYHRGLMLTNIKNEENITAVLIDILCVGNELISAIIIDKERALELARITNNYELISFIHQIDNYISISELVSYDMTNQELKKENTELKQVIKDIRNDYYYLKLEYDSILMSLKSDFKDKQDNEFISYKEALEIENKKLHDKIKEYEEKDLKHKQTLRELRNMIDNFNTELFSQ